MRKADRFLTVAWMLLLAPCLSAAQDIVPWTRDLEHAKQDAAQQSKLVLIHFSSLSCASCRDLEHYVFSHPEVNRSITENYVPVKVNVLGNPGLAQKFGVTRIPTDVFITPEGQELWRTPSPDNVRSYVGLVRRVAAYSPITARSPVQKLAQAARQRPVENRRTQYDVLMSSYQQQDVRRDDDARAGHAPAAVPQRSTATGLRGPAGTGQASDAGRRTLAAGPAANPWDDFHRGASAGRQYPAAPPPGRSQLIPNPQYDSNPQYRGPAGAAGSGPWTNQAQPAAPGSQRSGPGRAAAANRPVPNPYAQQPPASAARAPLFNAPGSPATGPAQPNNRAQREQPNPAWSGTPQTGRLGPGPNRRDAPWANSRPDTSGNHPGGSNVPQGRWNSSAAAPPQNPSAGAPPRPPYGARPAPNRQLPASDGKPPLAMDGYCPVSLLEAKDPKRAWVKGDVRWGAIHRGRTYLFAGPEQQRKFLANPDVYSPALSGYDAVRFVERNELVDGRREHGVSYRGQVFLFADEASLRTFWQNPARYAKIVHEAMRRNALGDRRR